MMRANFIIFSLLGLISVCVGQFVQNGQCDPNVPLESNFNLTEFVGTWYEIATSPSESQGDCARHNIIVSNTSAINVDSTSVRQNFLRAGNGAAEIVNGTARLLINYGANNLIDFSILMTDHRNYALGYSCQNLNATHRSISIWQLGRNTTYSTELMSALMNTTINNLFGINAANLQAVSHSDFSCYVLPVITPGQPIIIPGQCDANIPVVQNFAVTRFVGTWHEIASYHSGNALGECNRADYTLAGSVVNVVNSQVVNQTLETMSGTATVISSDGSARLNVILNIAPNVTASQDLWILATDYDSYAISYTCENLTNNTRRVYSWILSRNRQLAPSAEVQVNQVVDSIIELNNLYFTRSDQSDAACFYYPEPVPNQPVIFRGQCAQNLPVVQNFDAVRYMGLWHDTESYPTSFQGGTCGNAFYSLSGNGVDVFNTQVVNQTLDTINGVAVLASNDGSARLLVTFPIAGTNLSITTNYWVIATDYVSYSLVYSCTDLGNDRRQVTSWKLSRTKQMPASATALINNVVNSVDVLDQRYYQTMDQSPAGCFYVPEPQPGVPVVFPGQCDANIAPIPNFNYSLFEGTWHEIEAYPKEQQTGNCVSHQFNLGGTGLFNLTSSSVYDQFQAVTNAVVSRGVNDNSGRLTITLRVNGTDISFPYFILSTDYTSYALAYSCINIAEDFRGIWSWKLSRTRALTPAANTAINNAISPIQVLDNVYYEPIDHSADSCFYLPELAPGAPVILPGQCDPNIAVVQNFNAARYLGRWRLIEAYPSDNQVGTCDEATYTLGADGTVTVFNTEVINQTLSTITGTAVASADGSGILSVTFPNVPVPFQYWILDTDYDNYALVYGCVNVNAEQRRVWSFKLSRTNSLSQSANNAINQVINRVQVLNNRYYQTIDRSDAACFYYPTPSAGPVIFRGQCSPNIPVVQNFNAVAYMGLWHDIESYPTQFQAGTCNNAFYTLTPNGTVDVFNTEVVNQTLSTINGEAVVAATDGSARLIVSFPVAGTNRTTQTDYWVVATDYQSYSLVYSCFNIDSERRQVTSWKLSRSKQLTAAASTAISNVINQVDVLDQRYYLPRDQSPNGCFYFPEPQAGVPVVFPGQCDANIAPIPNFNYSLFEGTWHEIEAYPKEQQTGNCVSHQFNLGGTGLYNLTSSSVFDQFQAVTNAVVSRGVNDNSGRLTITLRVNGTDISFPYFILSTDYTSYALAYSCINIAEDFRGIWSWKLSRTRALTPAANTAINNAISSIQVLDNIYYEPIDHSADSCFYLPELAPGAPVILPGQCDPNIAVVQNFNAARYLGRWRLIEAYPSDNQVGTCDEATYTLGANGTVTVFNTEVINQTLSTITGTAVASADGSGILSVTFPNVPVPFQYLILDTDYDNYALVYGCVNVNPEQRRVWSFKLSRTNSLSQSANNAINQVINRVQVLNERYYQTIDRSDAACFYYPTPSAGPVIFRGQCSPNIPVVQNFNAVAYMGLWHDIESYPTQFQPGTCNNAFYTLTPNGTVDVFNTEVVNQTLSTINGEAVVAATDGSARLIVSFPVAGTNRTTQTDYWVVATDYQSYSLVYSCFNIDSESRQVTSWKLSRSKQLTAAASAAISNVINQVDVLDQRYYLPRDQSPNGCFYFPEPQPGVPVVFPGQCDANIAPIPNFNYSLFEGTWHEIEAYPKEQQTGNCVSHQFNLGGTGLYNLTSSSVYDQFQAVTNAVVSRGVNDNSGRLTITLRVNGTDISFPYIILSTDYTSYALAYSCINIAEDFRGIWSWKLSRTRSLTPAANTAINNAISSIQVLDNVYYERIDHSADACFYLPELAPGAPVILPGQCDPNITVIQNFNAARYLGRWRLIEAYPSDNQVGTCDEATYTLGANGTVTVFNTEVINQTLSTITGTAVASADGSGRLFVTFPNVPVPFQYWILDTDYDNYALVYGCVNVNAEQRRVWSFKLSRTNSLSQSANNAINQVINRVNVLDNRYFQTIDRSDAACFYFPEPNGNEVVFRGQCDQNINVVRNFDAVRYMGLWHDIESYPTRFQDGTCNNAFYTLINGTVDVFNTQVINQTLDTINGLAVLATTDGSAKLTVTFPVAGTNRTIDTDYWVLATDYQSYSLVYSCFNLDAERRQVTSWKLSRSKQLAAAASTAINNVINTVDVLDQRYYVSRDQSPNGCFYFPEYEPGVPVVFPGQCDTNITVVPNFSMSSFQGAWYEIQSYPSTQKSGQCISHQFNAGTGNTLNLISNNVLNQALGVSNGTVTFSSANDNSARLTVTITTNGTTTSFPLWILSTDYSSHALAYSCINVNNDQRAVWSWKLSRTRQLTATANTAINNAMANVDVLDNRYFESVNNTDDACFYLPDLGPGQPVVFPGQCDPNIAVIQNFNATRYLGRWRLIETYPSEFQVGGCNEATYSPGPNGTVIVFNTEVVNQSLSTMTGSASLATLDGTGKLTVTFPTTPTPAEYWILDTDYDNYAFVYSCVNIGNNQRRVWSWKMSRTNSLSQNAVTAINQVINRVNVLDNRYFQTIDRSDAGCFYFPEPSDSPVVFRGQCDQNIRVVQNFNAASYMGTWYDIQSYPTPFQRGTCNTAQYTLNAGGVVSVFNTQVVDQQLRTMNGSAVLTSTDGSARLSVTFLVDGVNVTTDYWVLDTDYTSYSLVYSCRNLDSERRQVDSWKLSRQQSLTPAANTAINNVINSVQVLRQDYYLQRDHSSTGCFFYPDNFGGDVILSGQCVPDNQVAAVTNFNINAFAGTWHELARFPSDLQNGECAASQYAAIGQNSFNVTQTIVRNERQLSSFVPSASVASGGRGVISANITGVPFSNVFVLATDYIEYALLYSCRNLSNNTKQIYSWKLSRSRAGLSANANNSINSVVSNNIDLFEGYYRNTDQSNNGCFHYPVFAATPAFIELPGPCDQSIRGVSNFNSIAYLGRWFEIARYPTTRQQGQCNRAELSASNTGLVVTNNQVVNQTLATISGTAVLASTDGSGQLNVTFVIGGAPRVASYYVLATDYSNFALVYHCSNLDNGNRRVGSWKLSRTTSLSTQANNIMDSFIGSTQGLLEEYYQPTSQSEESCFYIPEVNPNQAPVFRGQCENITQTIQNFSVERFLGWWHEIERFPVDGVAGECISSQYQQSGNQFMVVDTSVLNGSATVVTANLVATSDGRLRRTLPSGQVEDIWILATDYETYALLYSCSNVGTEHRRIWSAKHSRARSLTLAAQNAMAPAINASRVLYPQFYLPVDQSDRACFHYPEPTGQQIIIPGQCDMNIPVVQNFDVAAYGGTWYQIERYPQIHESGTCIGARYTLDANTGVVAVLNWEVINGTLVTIEGSAVLQYNDSSARLLVTLPVVGTNETVTTSLYVLATDYENYGLAYSCYNINSFQRAIGAWKLSRARTMSDAGTAAINAVMQRREELHQPYFRQIEHSTDCEEPSSALIVSSSLAVLLVCALIQLLM